MDAPSPGRPGAAEAHLRRFRERGEPEALGALFDETAPALFRIALRLSRDPAAAEDALQETFLALFDGAREWDPARPALPWLAGVLRHRVERVRREGARRPDPARLPPPRAEADPAAAAAGAEERERARRAMLDLEEPYRSVALLRWRYGLEPAEIAEVRGDPPGTVWSLLSRAKERLERALAGSPGLAVAFLPGEGLAALRGRVVAAAGARAAAAGAGAGAGTAAAAAGGLLVGKKVAWAAAAAAALLLLGGTALTLLAPRGGFRGRVVDASTGKPVPGAKVRLPGPGAPEAVTDRDGRFRIPAGPGAAAELAAEADGFPAKSVAAAAGGEAEILLEPGDEVRGRVVDASGRPVAGARVAIHPRTPDWRRTIPSSATGPDGRFSCAPVDRDNYHNCVVRAEGHGRLLLDFNPARDGPGVLDLGDLVLPPARRLEGTYWSGRGAPVPGVPLTLRGPLEKERACRAGGVAESGATGPDGRYRFSGLAPGRYSVANDVGAGVPRLEREFTVGDADVLDADLRVEGAGWIRVRVVDGGGAPVPGAVIAEAGDGEVFSKSGPDGVAVLEGLPAGKRVSVTAQGGLAYGAWPWVDLGVPDPAPADGRTVEIVVAKSAPIEGRVLDEEGEPVADVVVSLRSRPGSGPGRAAWMGWGATTRRDGIFRLRVPEGEVVDIEARDPSGPLGEGEALRAARAAAVRAPATDLLLRLRTIPRRGTLTLRLLDPAGLPVAGVDVEVWGGQAGKGRPARTDEGGRVRLEGLPEEEGPYWIGRPEGRAGGLPGVLPGPVHALPDGREVDVRLLPAAELRGTVLDPEGKPAPGARVIAFADGWSSGAVPAGEDGRFSAAVPAGALLKAIHARRTLPDGRRFAALLRDVRPADGEVTLRLEEE